MKYFGAWSDKEDVANDFQIDLKELKGARILLAWYGQEEYEGSAFVLFSRNGQLYEVNGGHCSCYQLEGQWEPEETTVAALLHRLEHGYCFGSYNDGDVAKTELAKLLKRRRNK